MKSPLLSIIIVNYNGMRWLPKLLESLNKQTYEQLEIVMVDNKSNDDSVHYLQTEHTSVKVVTSKNNAGFSAGNNLGIAESRGKYIMLLNTDVWLNDTFCSDMIKYYIENDFDVIAPIECKYDGVPREPSVSIIDIFGHPMFFQESETRYQSFYMSGVCLLFEKKMYLETGGLDENFFMYSEEVDWFWRLHLMKKRFNYAKDIYVYHAGAGTAGAGLNPRVFLWRNENVLQMIVKNYSLPNAVLIATAVLVTNIFEMLCFAAIGKSHIAKTYPQSWINVYKKRKSISKKRKLVQGSRILSDREVMKRMYMGFAKLAHLRRILFVKNV